MSPGDIPIIDVSALVTRRGDVVAVAEAIHRACCDQGFFYVSGHGIDPSLQQRLEALSRRFFSLDAGARMAIRMERAGKAWRGYFPVGVELTSGKPDWKEGLYFGSEDAPDDPRPLHGANLYPPELPELRAVVGAWMQALTVLGHRLMEGIARGLGLRPDLFAATWMQDPTILFRIFHYPPRPPAGSWGVGEHTDYGVLTILLQDEVGGLEVKSRGRWIDAPPVPGTFICNIGDMLDRMTGGLYRSTPHRVQNGSGRDRYSYPFFFDPGFGADVRRLPIAEAVRPDDGGSRWDGASVHAFEGTYGEYLLRKVARVFPELMREVRPGQGHLSFDPQRYP
jgi:isopenicillin N synthase-like dioxygenase